MSSWCVARLGAAGARFGCDVCGRANVGSCEAGYAVEINPGLFCGQGCSAECIEPGLRMRNYGSSKGSGASPILDKAKGRLLNAPTLRGAVAQMGERCNRTAEVRGSIPLGSTNKNRHLDEALCLADPDFNVG